MKSIYLAGSASVAVLTMFASPVQAQEAAPPPLTAESTSAEAHSNVLEEIVVTGARRRTEDVQSVPVAVGAFPEPFVHGYAGKVRPTVVLGPRTAVVRKVARLVHAGRVVPAASVRVRGDVNTLSIVRARVTRFFAEKSGGAVHFTYFGDPRRLLEPSFYRYRYRIP